MAQKVQVLLLDDIDGGEADETVTFALDGKTYEIDLNSANAEKLRETLAEFIRAGRRAGTGRAARGGRSAARASGGSGSADTARIRAWAKENGYEVNDRGRVPATIREAYEKATS
ncbi:Lsr2 family protein [Streptomyces calidiresistens]|uniref:Lsr2 family protein n=1 Tax=Streptomyces calidiresistens TaxID=1485586 RepID=A0A7W3T7Z4_9ACTN|nr:histone-like nucleoid-structuring protein Lsr2 [Streptomyces calidiresistens]MBB0232346.1 Lsr2 family protein [Streptomyces calidiresistens]